MCMLISIGTQKHTRILSSLEVINKNTGYTSDSDRKTGRRLSHWLWLSGGELPSFCGAELATTSVSGPGFSTKNISSPCSLLSPVTCSVVSHELENETKLFMSY